MKKMLFSLMALLCIWSAQAQKLDTLVEKPLFDKKLYMGLSFHNYWSNFKGESLPGDLFTKPSLGMEFLRVSYFFNKNFGVSVGLGYQQRGAGIKAPDVDKSLGNPDSTNRLRLRANCIELPIALSYHSQKAAFGIAGTRLSADLGLLPHVNFLTNQVYHSVEDGFHIYEKRTKDMYFFDAPLYASAGIDINSGNSTLLQIHLMGSYGLLNVFKSDGLYAGNNARTIMFGVRLSFLF